MRQFVLIFSTAALALAIGACSTMAEYETARQVRLGLRPPPTPTPIATPTPTIVATPTPAAAEPTETPVPKPLDKASGTLFQPWASPVPRDILGEKVKKSAEEAEAEVEATRPTISTDSAPGPGIPILKTLLRSPDDVAVVIRVFQAYADAVHAVRVSVDAFGLKPNLEGLRRVREAYDYWSLWFSRVHIFPDGPKPNVQDIKDFYAAISAQGKAAADDIAAINALIDQQRTRPVPTEVPEPSK